MNIKKNILVEQKNSKSKIWKYECVIDIANKWMEKLNEVKYDIGKFQEFVVDKKSLCFCLFFVVRKK